MFVYPIAVKGELMAKSSDVESLVAKNKDMEQTLLRKDEAINEMKRQTKKLSVSSIVDS
jgi:hypothetical protein